MLTSLRPFVWQVKKSVKSNFWQNLVGVSGVTTIGAGGAAAPGPTRKRGPWFGLLTKIRKKATTTTLRRKMKLDIFKISTTTTPLKREVGEKMDEKYRRRQPHWRVKLEINLRKKNRCHEIETLLGGPFTFLYTRAHCKLVTPLVGVYAAQWKWGMKETQAPRAGEDPEIFNGGRKFFKGGFQKRFSGRPMDFFNSKKALRRGLR